MRAWWGALLITFLKNLLYKPIFIQMMDGFSWLQNVRVWARPHRFLRSLGGHEREQSRRLVACQQRCCSHQSSGDNNSTPAAGCRGRSSHIPAAITSIPYWEHPGSKPTSTFLNETTKNLGLLGHLFSTFIGLFSFWPFPHPPIFHLLTIYHPCIFFTIRRLCEKCENGVKWKWVRLYCILKF